MTASQANQAERLNSFFYISGSAVRSWLLLGGLSFPKQARDLKAPSGISYAKNNSPCLPLSGISHETLNFPLYFKDLSY